MRHVELRSGGYADSVRLMQVSQAVRGTPGVGAAIVAMATETNVALLAAAGFDPPPRATPNDLVVAVDAADEDALRAALDRLAAELAPAPPGARGGAAPPGPATAPPRTVGSAARRLAANLVLVSTPGRHAFAEAMDALDAGASVMVFSDNVPVEQEVLLKDTAAARGLLVMGPDCGTAVVGGVGLGFANVVRPGPVGCVSASGTGAQHVMCLLDRAGVGISHCLGVGGRDLSAAVAGRATHAALDALDADSATELIVVVSKPPGHEVAAAVRDHAARLSTPVRFALLGEGRPDLTRAVERVLGTLGRPAPDPWPAWPPAGLAEAPDEAGGTARGTRTGALRGLFAGGTLCVEAVLVASAGLGPVLSNVAPRPQWRLPAHARPAGHRMTDLGDDPFTRDRPHPMIDNSLRLEWMAAEAADPDCAVLLLDVVLGHLAHADPAAELGPAIAEASGGGTAVVVSLTGTAGDPQGLDRQAARLRAAGAAVFASNAAAARHAAVLARAGAAR